MSSSNCCFLTCIQISQEAGQVIWYSHLFQKERGLLQSISKFLISKPRKLSWIIHHPDQCSQKKYPAHYRLIPEEIPPLTAQYMLLLLSHFSRVWLCDPTDSSPPGSSVPGILQARTLECVAISFSNACMHAVASVVSDSVGSQGQQPTRLLCLWDSPSKNTGVACHFLLQHTI